MEEMLRLNSSSGEIFDFKTCSMLFRAALASPSHKLAKAVMASSSIVAPLQLKKCKDNVITIQHTIQSYFCRKINVESKIFSIN